MANTATKTITGATTITVSTSVSRCSFTLYVHYSGGTLGYNWCRISSSGEIINLSNFASDGWYDYHRTFSLAPGTTVQIGSWYDDYFSARWSCTVPNATSGSATWSYSDYGS